MERVDILVIGGGVVGLAVAYALSEDHEDVVLVEKEDTFGLHTSSRNSEVIHSGIYYPQNSLKAVLCLRGAELMYDFAKLHDIPFQNCGKLVVASNEAEIPALQKLKENGEKNGVPGLQIIDDKQCRELEPRIKAKKALYVPTAGIINTHTLMQNLEYLAEKRGAFLVYDMNVISIDTLDDGYLINFSNGEIFEARLIINCAGLFSDKIAQMVGLNIKKNKLELHWCKGEYYKISKLKDIKHLVYPVADLKAVSLGIHLTINLLGEARFGPNAYYVTELNYAMDNSFKEDFLKAIEKYIDIDTDLLMPDDCGIRPKLQVEGGDFRDFYIQEESNRGLPNFINCIGIESPGLTAALAIAEKIKKMVDRL